MSGGLFYANDCFPYDNYVTDCLIFQPREPWVCLIISSFVGDCYVIVSVELYCSTHDWMLLLSLCELFLFIFLLVLLMQVCYVYFASC